MEEVENTTNGPAPKDESLSQSPAKTCALCGCSTPAVRCDRCSSQIFCLSCDDMYHKHPKRRFHLRKAVDSIWNSARSPRLRRRTELPGDPSKIPIPPPRSKRRERHTIAGRMFMKPHELGSFGHSKADMRTISPNSRNVFAGQKSPINMDATYENGSNYPANVAETSNPSDIYENENVSERQTENENSNLMSRSPWGIQRTNISSPIQVSIPSNSPDLMTNGQSFGYSLKPQSRSITDLTGAPVNPIGAHPYHLPHYPYMHPTVHPSYSHSMSHLNCAQCLSSPWTGVMSPHPSPYFHPMPWGHAHGSVPGPNDQAHLKHGQGNAAYFDSSFQFPFPGVPYFTNGGPTLNPSLREEMLQQTDDISSPKVKKTSPKQARSSESLAAASSPTPELESCKMEESASASPPNTVKHGEEEDRIPQPPSQPWSCMHCTFINPPGIHICQVCCKTSYGNHALNRSDEQSDDPVTSSRFSDSPELVNMDAMQNSTDFEYAKAQKVM